MNGKGRKLKKTISLLDATSIGVGAIVGAGIFVVLGVGAGLAGPAVILSLVIAGVVALLTALSFVQLSEQITREGGAYGFARELISPFGGFLTGFLWIVSNIVAGATVSLGFAYYASALLPSLPVVPLAVLACLAATAINYAGVKDSVRVNNALVGTKLLTLIFFIAAGFLFLNLGRFHPFAPMGLGGILSGAALIFFAYGGFARITTVSEEVEDAGRTVPKAILLALGISAALYVLVAIAAIGLSDYKDFSRSGSFLATAISSTKISYAALIVSIGALAATASVLLTTVLGISRVLFAMSKNGELPDLFSSIASNGVPRNAVLASGLASALLAMLGDLTLVASISSFAMLAYYASANFSALRLREARFPKIIPLAGATSCIALLVFLSPRSILIGFAAVLCGSGYYFYRFLQKKEKVRQCKPAREN
ncbi:MAG: amino acid permease [Candidatus Micrarchaeota archaeon]